MTDETLMAETIGKLTEDLKHKEEIILQKNQEYYDLEVKCKDINSKLIYNEWYEGISGLLIVIFSITIITMLCGYPLYMASTTSDTPTMCHIRKGDTKYQLIGIVEWGSDINYGWYGSIEDAMEVAEINNCNFNHRQQE